MSVGVITREKESVKADGTCTVGKVRTYDSV